MPGTLRRLHLQTRTTIGLTGTATPPRSGPWRLIDRRMQAMRKSGRIKFMGNARNNPSGRMHGWLVCIPETNLQSRTTAMTPEAQQPLNPFDVVQQRLAELAGDQQLMVYYWPNSYDGLKWEINCGNPSKFVMLGEVSGRYRTSGKTLQEAFDKLVALIADNATGGH